MVNTKRQKVAKIEKLDNSEEYVYDISMKHLDPFFFANGHLVHNTDSVYFSVWPVIKEQVESGEMDWDVDIAIGLYDGLADEVNDSFPAFMTNSYNCPTDYGNIIKCGREVVGSNGLFITKKRYAIMVLDNEGKRYDTDGSPGKMKAMGLDLKRSDTPPVVQEFLKDILTDTLNGHDKEVIIEKVLEFKEEFNNLPSWEKGAPKRVNNLTMYSAQMDKAKIDGSKPRIPGHVRAGYNYNNLRKLNNDNYTMAIGDGSKAIICKLKDNPLGITSVARPTDENNIPQWFKDLPFNDASMLESVVDKKVDNLLGVLKWDLKDRTNTTTTFGSLFDF